MVGAPLVFKQKNQSLWTEEGYQLFAEEGLDGIQVERLARILGLNKSGFYYYFSDLEGYCTELLSLHQNKISEFLREVRQIKKFDPDYLQLLMKHATTFMFQVQLTRHKSKSSFYEASEIVDHRINLAVRALWSEYVDDPGHSDLSIRYYYIIRDMIYARISFRKLEYDFLRSMVSEARALFIEIRQHEPVLQTVKSNR
jgi:AcrR family transcriptional regulator